MGSFIVGSTDENFAILLWEKVWVTPMCCSGGRQLPGSGADFSV